MWFISPGLWHLVRAARTETTGTVLVCSEHLVSDPLFVDGADLLVSSRFIITCNSLTGHLYPDGLLIARMSTSHL